MTDDLKAKVLEEGDCFGILYDGKDPSCKICTVKDSCSKASAPKPPSDKLTRREKKMAKAKENALVAKVREALEGLEPEEIREVYEKYAAEYEVEKAPKKGKEMAFLLDTIAGAADEDEDEAALIVNDILAYANGDEEEVEDEDDEDDEDEEVEDDEDEDDDDEEEEEAPAPKKGKGKAVAKEAPKPKRTVERKSNTPRPTKFGERPERSAQKTIEEEFAKGTPADKVIAMIAKEFYDGDSKPATRRYKNATRKLKAKMPAVVEVTKAKKAKK